MVEFKKFMAVWLSVVVAVSVFTVAAVSLFQSGNKGVTTPNHFSVRWMGFIPTDYSSPYSEYYICINNLKNDPLQMSIALEIKNQENQPYHFKVDRYEAPPSGWTILPKPIGQIVVDETKPYTYTGAYRSRPASIPQGRLTESINLMVQAYYDAGYINLYSQDNFTVTFNFLDLSSSEWSVVYQDDFDDGTTQGWTYTNEGYYSYGANVEASATYYRSFQYSLRLHAWTGPGSSWVGAAFRKDFIVGLPSEAYLIYSIRSDDWSRHNTYGVKINGVTYFKSDVAPSTNIWYQFAIPLPKGQTSTVDIWAMYKSGSDQHSYAYLDDVYVIIRK